MTTTKKGRATLQDSLSLGSSAIWSRPAAFRPCLPAGIAFHGRFKQLIPPIEYRSSYRLHFVSGIHMRRVCTPPDEFLAPRDERATMEFFIRNSPKAKLHLHIEGTLEPELMRSPAGAVPPGPKKNRGRRILTTSGMLRPGISRRLWHNPEKKGGSFRLPNLCYESWRYPDEKNLHRRLPLWRGSL